MLEIKIIWVREGGHLKEWVDGKLDRVVLEDSPEFRELVAWGAAGDRTALVYVGRQSKEKKSPQPATLRKDKLLVDTPVWMQAKGRFGGCSRRLGREGARQRPQPRSRFIK